MPVLGDIDMFKIIAGTHNAHKLGEFRQLLKDQDVEVVGLEDYPDFVEVEETGTTFKENAELKALAANLYCDIPAIADDSGLVVEALDGAPGIHSSRYAENDAARMEKLLKELGNNENRRAKFVCALTIAMNGEIIETFIGEVHGMIADAPRGDQGFGYDPLFIPDGYDKTFGELSADIKDKISHRAHAFELAMEFIEDEMSCLDDEF
jgi:XTP/dITP diphosphohydrolase